MAMINAKPGRRKAPLCTKCGEVLTIPDHHLCDRCYSNLLARNAAKGQFMAVRAKQRIAKERAAAQQRKAECVRLGLVMGVIPGVNDDT